MSYTKSLLLLFLAIGNCTAVSGQTYVSGGIYTNTIWTFANSPYIVTANVVLFPGHTLTIEPGVVVKLDSGQQLEIRQSTLIAEGTMTDPIVFTSNSLNPVPGSWNNVYLNESTGAKMNYCKFQYADIGLFAEIVSLDSLILKNVDSYFNHTGMQISGKCILDSCKVFYNDWGIHWGNAGFSIGSKLNYCSITNNTYNGLNIYTGIAPIRITNCNFSCNGQFGLIADTYSTSFVDSCYFEYNQVFGIETQGRMNITNCIFRYNNYAGIGFNDGDTISHCLFQYNGMGVFFNYPGGYLMNNIIEYDSIGIFIRADPFLISCNVIQNNTAHGVRYELTNNSNCVINNYWGTTDSAAIEGMIYDGYDSTAYGLLSFIPFDSVPCPGAGPVPFQAPAECMLKMSVTESSIKKNELFIYPNPAGERLAVIYSKDENIIISDLTGKILLNRKFRSGSNGEIELDVSFLLPGIYFIKVGSKVGRFVKE